MAKKRSGGQPAPTPEAAVEEAAGDETEETAKPQPTWRAGLEFIVMMAGAVAIALVIKAYVVDVYLIPSGSMETALHGRPDGGDRIVCSKLHYHFRDLKRWEVAVFEFPYETALRSPRHRISEEHKGQNFVKRVVGLPGESLAIARGDIWVRREGERQYSRMVKPDSVQRGMWLHVYEEDFSDLRRNELNLFWNIGGADVRLVPGGLLVLSPGDDVVNMAYRPLVPVGDRKRMVEPPGITDRYTLEQPVQFRCLNRPDGGEACGHVFVKRTWTHNMYARCPKCGSLQDETAATFYHRRSGLPEYGPYAVKQTDEVQGEDTQQRQSDYYFVPDLRVVADLTLGDINSRFAVTLREDDSFVQAIFHGNGQVELEIDGEASLPEHRMLADIAPGRKHRLEFYFVDGTARVFVDSEKQSVLDVPLREDRRPLPRSLVKASGVSIGAAGGDVAISRLSIDRDVFYYSGWEHNVGEKFAAMNSQGEIFISKDSFFPMGDHTASSFDARSWGPVPLELLRGPALAIWWPPERVSLIAAP